MNNMRQEIEVVEETEKWHRFCNPEMWHSAANLYPRMDDTDPEAFRQLVADIKANGLLSRIVLISLEEKLAPSIHDDSVRVLDGRNRLLACREAGVEPRFEFWHDHRSDSPIQYVVSQNTHRRHLTSDQRKAIAAAAVLALQDERQSKLRRLENLVQNQNKSESASESESVVSIRKPSIRDEVAAQFGLAGRTIQPAITTAVEAPDVLEQQKQGKIKERDAVKIVRARKAARKVKGPKHSRKIPKLVPLKIFPSTDSDTRRALNKMDKRVASVRAHLMKFQSSIWSLLGAKEKEYICTVKLRNVDELERAIAVLESCRQLLPVIRDVESLLERLVYHDKDAVDVIAWYLICREGFPSIWKYPPEMRMYGKEYTERLMKALEIRLAHSGYVRDKDLSFKKVADPAPVQTIEVTQMSARSQVVRSLQKRQRVTAEQRTEIRKLLAEDKLNQAEIAAQFKVSQGTISNIARTRLVHSATA